MVEGSTSFPAYLDAQKAELRQRMKTLRRAAWLAHPDAGLALRDVFSRSFQLPTDCVVASYAPRMDEMDPTPLALDLYLSGHKLALPVVGARDAPLTFRSWVLDVPLEKGSFGVLTPPPDAPIAEPDVLLVPLLAFDKMGNRIGYGGGYYDRTLRALRARKKIIAIGLAYAAQEEGSVPVGEGDFRLDAVVTETGVR